MTTKVHTSVLKDAEAHAQDRANRDQKTMSIFVRWEDPPRYFVRSYEDGWLESGNGPYDCVWGIFGFGGLCHLVRRNKDADRRLQRYCPEGLDYDVPWWPITREGWDARAAFCWRMAEECEREENQR